MWTKESIHSSYWVFLIARCVWCDVWTFPSVSRDYSPSRNSQPTIKNVQQCKSMFRMTQQYTPATLNTMSLWPSSGQHNAVTSPYDLPWLCNYLFLFFLFSVRLLSVLRDHSGFSSPPQRPMTSDFKGFSIADCIHYIYFPILILEKEPVFSLLNVQC